MDGDTVTKIEELTSALCAEIAALGTDAKVDALNAVRRALHDVSPFKAHPVDCVLWVKADQVISNAVNPNKVAPPEMKALHESIKQSGFTMPVYAADASKVDMPRLKNGGGTHVVIDGHHRGQIVKKYKDIEESTYGYQPVTEGKPKDIASLSYEMYLHNDARGKWDEQLSVDMVAMLSELGEGTHRMAKKLNMEAERLLRMKANTGMAASFAKEPFSRSWIAVDGDGDLDDERGSADHV
jgi:hypothetical protein